MAHGEHSAIDTIRRSLARIGYGPALVRQGYEFADFLSPGSPSPIRVAELAAFFQTPTSYRNACLAVVSPNGLDGAPLVAQYRALGAPMVFELAPNALRRWAMTSQADPRLLDSVEYSNVGNAFDEHRLDWGPDSILRAKGLGGQSEPTQLDFFDLGLLPLLQREVQSKLDRVLQSAIRAAMFAYDPNGKLSDSDFRALYRLIFRLVAGKLHSDRRSTNNYGQLTNADTVLAFIDDFYFKNTKPVYVLTQRDVPSIAWDVIARSFDFGNLSVDALSYVYENTLVTKETRKTYGTHGTPSSVAEFIVRHLPFEKLDVTKRKVFEPFSGHAVFLVAAMQRMKDLLGTSMASSERHDYFTASLTAMETESFAREVAWLSLVLADYPNPDNWRITEGDVFESQDFPMLLKNANIVLCNPPFELFNDAERRRYSSSHPLVSPRKPVEALARVLEYAPDLLGFVLPRIFVDGREFRPLREKINRVYGEVQVVTLPDRVFRHSDAESVLLMASERGASQLFSLTSGGVFERDLKRFLETGKVSYQSTKTCDREQTQPGDMLWLPDLDEVWERLRKLKPLSSCVKMIHRGVQFNQPIHGTDGEIKEHLISAFPVTSRHKRGLYRVPSDVEPFILPPTVYLNLDPQVMRLSGIAKLPWDAPKVAVNAHRLSRGPWPVVAVVDNIGLALYQNYIGIWPFPDVPLDFIAAILNSPVANAYVASHEGKRDVQVRTLESLPFPTVREADTEAVTSLVAKYRKARESWLHGSDENGALNCANLLSQIDARILDLYGLPPRLERELLNRFSKTRRPGGVPFDGYFPEDFKPYISWSLYLSSEYRDSRVSETLKRLRPIHDAHLAELLKDVGL